MLLPNAKPRIRLVYKFHLGLDKIGKILKIPKQKGVPVQRRLFDLGKSD